MSNQKPVSRKGAKTAKDLWDAPRTGIIQRFCDSGH
jgi:hypothetical protein